jgi:hypothetical protein
VDQVSAGADQDGADSDADSGAGSGGAQLLAADPDQVALGTQRVLRGESGLSECTAWAQMHGAPTGTRQQSWEHPCCAAILRAVVAASAVPCLVNWG